MCGEHRREGRRNRGEHRHVGNPEHGEAHEREAEAQRHHLEHGDGKNTHRDRGEEPQRTAAELVRCRAEDRHEQHDEQLADEDHDERGLRIHADLRLEVGRHVGQQCVVDHVDGCNERKQDDDVAAVLLEHRAEAVHCRGVVLFRVFLDFIEHRGVFKLRAQVPADEAHGKCDEERDPPAEGVHLLRGHGELDDEHECRTDDVAGQRARLEERTEEAAATVGRVLSHVGGGTAVLTAGGKALHQAQDNEQNGCPDADRLVGGKQSDEGCCPGHEQNRGGQHALAADLVAHGTPEEPAQGSCQEGNGVRRHGGHDLVFAECIEEVMGDIRCGDRVDAVVVPLGHIADGRCSCCPADNFRISRVVFGFACVV